MNEIQQKQEAINTAILNRSAVSAFDDHDAAQVTRQENNQPPSIGKEANRIQQEEFFQSITVFLWCPPPSGDYGEGRKYGRMELLVPTCSVGEPNYRQVAVQQWENGKIVASSPITVLNCRRVAGKEHALTHRVLFP